MPFPVETSPVHIPDKSILDTTFEYLPQISQKRNCKARQDVRRDLLTCSATTLHTGAALDFDTLSEARLRENTFAAIVCPHLRLPCMRLRGLLSRQCMMPTVEAVPAEAAASIACDHNALPSASLKAHFTWADYKCGDANLRG